MPKKKARKPDLKQKLNSIFKNRLVIGGLIALFLLLAIPVILISYITFVYSGKIYPGVKVAGISVSGKSQKETKEILESTISQFMDGKLNLVYSENLEIDPKEIGVKFDTEKSAEEAYKFGRTGSVFSGFFSQLKTLFYSQNLPLCVSVDDGKTFNILNNILEEINQPVENAAVELTDSEIVIKEGQTGRRMLLYETYQNLISALGNLSSEVTVSISEILPQITKEDIKSNKSRIEDLITYPVVLEYLGQKWEVTSSEIISWLEISATAKKTILSSSWFSPGNQEKEDNLSFDIDRDEVSVYIGKLAEKIDKPMQNAKLTINDGKATVFQPSVSGRKLNQEKTITAILEALNGDNRLVELPVEIIPAEVREDNLNTLGIKELIASGYSNFSGSPTNRIHNIKVGASKFNGILIKPGATFSFNETLGPVEAYTGYLPELVILKDRTVPQYGGGLCQVSTTAFRAALNASFPIVERYPHAYPVVYYNPLGTDATIYPPHPDLRFVNDSGFYVLIQTRVTGNYLYFDFYGTKGTKYSRFSGYKNEVGAVDQVEKTKTYTYNWGVRGSGSADAVFYRFVYDAGALVRTDEFLSHFDSPDKYPH
ncbi:MAG: hypothetical protein GTN40_05015 [Candidatus Aenigmarchaeota archaeon]|nr:hypothetical protein [Candidatus Aenigmarchaeota archaeon]